MISLHQESATSALGEVARRRLLSVRGEPMFYADWERAVFIHFEVNAKALQAEVPFGLDLREGRACVSLVAFTMRGLRPRLGGRLGAWLFKPIASHEYLNVRTYVRCRGEPGIYFLAEWLPNPLSVRLGPWPFGLPYRLGNLDFQQDHDGLGIHGIVADRAGGGRLEYRGQVDEALEPSASPANSIEEFRMERYTAFTQRGTVARYFRIWHEPWLQSPMHLEMLDESLLAANFPWFRQAQFVGANYSAGVFGVQMGWPHRITRAREGNCRSAFFDMP